MKRLNLIMIFIGVAIIFFGCSKDNSLAPTDDVTNSYKAQVVHTHFAGECTPITPPGTTPNAWYDDVAVDARVTGVTIWITENEIPLNEVTTKLDGTAELFVGALNLNDVYNGNFTGIWQMTWRGTVTTTGQGLKIVCHVDGIGVEGVVLELTARWKYTMNWDGTPETFMYITKGKITESL